MVHTIFRIGAFLKGADGLVEILGAAILLVVTPRQVSAVVLALVEHEISHDPHDFVATHLLLTVGHVSTGGEHFASAYLAVHGVIKLALVWALLRSKQWAYPIAIAIFTAFGVYQMYRYALSHSAAMLGLTVLDAFVILFTSLEYRRVRGGQRGPRSRRETASAPAGAFSEFGHRCRRLVDRAGSAVPPHRGAAR